MADDPERSSTALKPAISDRGQPRRRRRVRGLSLRMLMLIVLLAGGWMGWYGRSVRAQRDAVAAITRAGGSVSYDFQQPFEPQPLILLSPPKWLVQWLGVDYFSSVVTVEAQGPLADDALLVHVGRLTGLRNLRLQRTRVTDAGLQSLKPLSRLTYLTIRETPITDAGIQHLARLPSVHSVDLGNTRISDRGVAEFERASSLRFLWLQGTPVSDEAVLNLQIDLPDLVQVARDGDFESLGDTAKAHKDLNFARAQPDGVACRLLVSRALFVALNDRKTDFIATIDALCQLQPNDKYNLIELARACDRCIPVVDTGRPFDLTHEDRRDLKERCTARGLAALVLAIKLGYQGKQRLERDLLLSHLRLDPRFQTLIEKLDKPAVTR